MKTRGYITLVSVIVASAVGVAIATVLLTLGITSLKSALVAEQSVQARSLADACAEEGLVQIQANTGYAGRGNLSLGAGSCDYTVTNTGGTTRSVTASGTVGTIVRKVSVTVSAVSPVVTLSTWQEVAD